MHYKIVGQTRHGSILLIYHISANYFTDGTKNWLVETFTLILVHVVY